MVYSYPSTITTTTGRSTQYNTQKLSNKNALCSNSTELAYWGVQKPTWVGNYLRNYPDSLTSISGSYYKPESFYASGFNVDAPDEAIVQSIKIQYAWEQVSYSSKTAFGSFEAPKIDVMLNAKVLQKITGKKPDAIRYNNATDSAHKNTNKAELVNKRSHTVNLSSYGITIADLRKKFKLHFIPAKNSSHNHLRVIMQFIRIDVTYKDIDPTLKITASSSKSANFESEYTAKFTVQSTNNRSKATDCTITFSDAHTSVVKSKTTTGSGTFKKVNGVWTWHISKYSNHKAVLELTLKNYQQTPEITQNTITGNILQYYDSKHRKASTTTKLNKTTPTPTSTSAIRNLLFYTNKSSQQVFNENDGIYLTVSLVRNIASTKGEYIEIDTKGLLTDSDSWSETDGLTITHQGNGVWRTNNFNKTSVTLISKLIALPVGDYYPTAKVVESGSAPETKDLTIIVLGKGLKKEYFKLRLEDGSDVRYNSLVFTQGDDLTIPLTYTIEDIANPLIDDIHINGETKRMPTNEARFIGFDVDIFTESNELFSNTIFYFEVTDIDGNNCDEIIIGAEDGIDIYDGNDGKYCIVRELESNVNNKLKFIVMSDTEMDYITFKIKPLNYDKYETGEWKPAKIIFSDMANIKLGIEGISDLTYTNEEEAKFTLTYTLENKSNITGKNLKFKLTEPPNFKRLGYEFEDENPEVYQSPYFNTNNRTIFFPEFEANSKVYKIKIDYQATYKGIYDFIMRTLDDATDTEDDLYANSVTHKMLVNVSSYIDINTFVSKNNPYLNELFDFKITVKNFYKSQDKFIFNIRDIGQYNVNHQANDYTIEYVDCPNGEFVPSSEGNLLGTWTLQDIGIGDEYQIILSLRPTDTGIHAIQTVFIDSNSETQDFENTVKVLEPNHKLEFNVYHAVGDGDCRDCDALTEICDEDFINLGDDIYYVFEITNNERNAIKNLHAYARVPQSFGEVLCYTPDYQPEISENGLISFTIPQVEMCSTLKFCIKFNPKKKGEYDANFMLSTRNAKVLHKKLHLTIDDDFNERRLEHEINIYNFEKTHRYFRYELDGDGNLFKFFNAGDISKRTVDFDPHRYSAIETYRGNNLKKLVEDIKNNSKYVEPELLRIGTNKLANKGYEMYPNGFINRFGLLKSEVHHYTGQFPIITNLVDYAMRWDIDNWDEKVWTGDIYQNGVFDLSIDYAKIPTNFNILELQNPIGNLQALADKVKPVGTKAICYYSASVQFELRMNIDLLTSEIGNIFDFDLEFDNMGLISWYNRHDNSYAIYYDLTNFAMTIDDFRTLMNYEYPPEPADTMETEMTYTMEVYTDEFKKVYINDCFDIVKSLYEYNDSVRNIAISKPLPTENIIRRGAMTLKDGDIYTIFSDGDCKISFDDIYVMRNGNEIICSNGKVIKDNIYNVALQMQRTGDIVHIWASKNNEHLFHIGYYIIDGIPEIELTGDFDYSYSTEDLPITFLIDDEVKTISEKHNELKTIGSQWQWDYLNRIGDGYSYIENGNDIDIKCKDDYLKIPKLLLRYDNIFIDDTDEIIDIKFDIKAQTNKQAFADDLTINLYKDGDYYLPNKNISHKNYYANNITNVNKSYVSTLTIQQPNITICSSCLKTSLGYYDACPYCNSTDVSHTDEKQPATVCYNCGWIENGWYNRCPHCLSRDIEKVEIDYNKTYCYDCKAIYNDYYNACPHCFSTNIVHLQNDEKTYNIFDETTKNISPIVIQGDINRANICNITVPLGQKSESINLLEQLDLGINIKNGNEGKYYYCPDCERAGLGNAELCPHCNSESIVNYQIDALDLDIYMNMNGKISLLDTVKVKYGDNEIKLDILEYARNNNSNEFTLMCYVENVKFQSNSKALDKLEKYAVDEIKQANHMNVIIDNIWFDSKYLNEKEWIDIDEFEGLNHKAVKYITTEDGNTDYINFSNFYIDENNLDKLYLTVKGINKSYAHIHMGIRILDNQGNSYSTTIYNVKNNMFEVKENIYDLIEYKNFDTLSVQLNFINVKSDKEIIITDCYMTTEQTKSDYTLPEPIDVTLKVERENNIYHISDADEEIWGINKTKPHYLSGEQVKNGLFCIIDFGKLNLQEYIRLYDIDMIVFYKNKYGTFATDAIPIIDLDKTHCYDCGTVSDGEYEQCPVCNSSNVMYLDATEYPIQLVSGNINRNNGTNWGAIKISDTSLNNLEYDINIRAGDEKYINSIPLFNRLLQSFTATDTNIYKIKLNYFGSIGYPSNHIMLSLYDDNGGNPDNLIAKHQIEMPDNITDIDESFYIDSLDIGEQYWIVLEDYEANENNYHRFRYNNNIEIGNLIYEKDGVEIRDYNMALSFAIDTGYNTAEYQSLPITWSVNNDINSDFKIHNSLYRYNAQSTSNVQLKNLSVKSGYTYSDDEYEIIEDDEVIEDIYEEDDEDEI